jgi:hypothetical protein
MAQGQWATQQSGSPSVAASYTEGVLFTRGYQPNYVAGTASNSVDTPLIDAITALMLALPQSIVIAWSPTAGTAATIAEQTVVVTGSNGVVGDRVLVNYPGAPTANIGMCMGARVSTAGVNATVSVPFICAAGTPTPPSGNYVFTFLRT